MTFETEMVFDETVLKGLPPGTLCLLTGSYTVHVGTFVRSNEGHLDIPGMNCIMDGISAREEG